MQESSLGATDDLNDVENQTESFIGPSPFGFNSYTQHTGWYAEGEVSMIINKVPVRYYIKAGSLERCKVMIPCFQ